MDAHADLGTDMSDEASAVSATSPAFDADNHSYEALDACTRNAEQEFAKRPHSFARRDNRPDNRPDNRKENPLP